MRVRTEPRKRQLAYHEQGSGRASPLAARLRPYGSDDDRASSAKGSGFGRSGWQAMREAEMVARLAGDEATAQPSLIFLGDDALDLGAVRLGG